MKFNMMDHTGHTTEAFDKTNKVSMEEAEKRFEEITGLGFRAAEHKADGKQEFVKGFDPNVEEYTFVRPIQGG